MRTQPDWLRESEIGVALALCAVFGLNPESDEAIGFIRYKYRDNQNVPEGLTKRDMVYITLSSTADPSSAWAAVAYKSVSTVKNGVTEVSIFVEQTKPIPLNCLLTFYGDHAREYAEQARSGLMIDTGPGSPRYILRDRKLVPAGWPDNPVTTPEPVAGIWRMRSDLRMHLNRLQVDQYPFLPVAEAPVTRMKLNPNN